MKLKVRDINFKETEHELPVYFSWESDGLRQEYVKWDGKEFTRVVYDFGDIKIEKGDTYYADEVHLRALCSKEVFDEAFQDALKIISE